MEYEEIQDLEKLSIGALIKKPNAIHPYVVSTGYYGEYIIASRTIHITNLSEWRRPRLDKSKPLTYGSIIMHRTTDSEGIITLIGKDYYIATHVVEITRQNQDEWLVLEAP